MRICTYLVAAALTLPLFAQEEAPKTVAVGPVLVLKTSRDEVAAMVAAGLEHPGALPDLPAGGHYVLTLGSDKKLSVITGAGDVGMLEVTADPEPLMTAFAAEMEKSKAMVRGVLTVAMQEAGMAPKDAAAFVKDVLEFPRQLQKVSLKITGDPETFPEEAIEVTLDIESKEGSAFGAIVGKLSPCAQGAPALRLPGAAFQVEVSLSPEGLQALLVPFRPLAMNFIAPQDEALKQQATAAYDKFLALYDGGFAVSLGAKKSIFMLMGVLDGDKARELLASDEYRSMMKNQRMPNRDMEVAVEFDALEHRGVKLIKSTVTGGAPNPLMTDGSLESLMGLVGNYYALSMGGGVEGAKKLIDMISDQQVKRAPLPADVVLQLTMDMAALMAVVAPTVGQLPPDAPTTIGLTVSRRGKGLRLHYRMD